jgi:hypothetical protein
MGGICCYEEKKRKLGSTVHEDDLTNNNEEWLSKQKQRLDKILKGNNERRASISYHERSLAGINGSFTNGVEAELERRGSLSSKKTLKAKRDSIYFSSKQGASKPKASKFQNQYSRINY